MGLCKKTTPFGVPQGVPPSEVIYKANLCRLVPSPLRGRELITSHNYQSEPSGMPSLGVMACAQVG